MGFHFFPRVSARKAPWLVTQEWGAKKNQSILPGEFLKPNGSAIRGLWPVRQVSRQVHILPTAKNADAFFSSSRSDDLSEIEERMRKQEND
jgi:hypothetical protein